MLKLLSELLLGLRNPRESAGGVDAVCIDWAYCPRLPADMSNSVYYVPGDAPLSCCCSAGSPALLSPAPGNRGSGDASFCAGSQGGLDKDLGSALALFRP